VRRWNQTGQKYAGEPDIARTYLSGHNETLWGLVTAAYLWNTYSLAKHGFSNMPRLVGMTLSSTLTTIALTFKLAFTMEDSPELLRGIPALSLDPSLDFSLVNKARAVFVGIAAVLAYSVVIDSFNTTKLGHKGILFCSIPVWCGN
jgi:ethanolaminephosphotransferase